MPQISTNNFEDFKKWLSDQKITCFKKQIVPSKYKATQKEFNQEKINGMIKKGLVKRHDPNPIFVSRDGYILDGHHRWLAHWVEDDLVMNAIEIPFNVKDCLQLMHNYDKVEIKKVSEELKT